jgi:hypothetical protein
MVISPIKRGSATDACGSECFVAPRYHDGRGAELALTEIGFSQASGFPASSSKIRSMSMDDCFFRVLIAASPYNSDQTSGFLINDHFQETSAVSSADKLTTRSSTLVSKDFEIVPEDLGCLVHRDVMRGKFCLVKLVLESLGVKSLPENQSIAFPR